MELSDRIHVLEKLGEYIASKDDYLSAVVKRTSIANPWFTESNQWAALNALSKQFLEPTKLLSWINSYKIPENSAFISIGIIMAGNLPLVGFHDFLSVFITGNKAQIKLSEKDPYLLPHLLKMLEKFNTNSTDYFEIVEKLSNFDAVIATGSNNTARYFEKYFSEHPNIIRKNRSSVAILTGNESDSELLELGKDIFQYFGLGCRNVSKIYIPEEYDLKRLLTVLHEYQEIINHNKYKNNFDYNFALYSLNNIPFDINGAIILKEDSSLHSRIATLHYEYYKHLDELISTISAESQNLQCIVSQKPFREIDTVYFGQTQTPGLSDYADNVDTVNWILSLN